MASLLARLMHASLIVVKLFALKMFPELVELAYRGLGRFEALVVVGSIHLLAKATYPTAHKAADGRGDSYAG